MCVKKSLVTILLAVGLLASSVPSFAVTAEEILEVLVNKGIITRAEYEILLKGPSKATLQPTPAGESKKAEPVAAQPEAKSDAKTATTEKPGVGELLQT